MRGAVVSTLPYLLRLDEILMELNRHSPEPRKVATKGGDDSRMSRESHPLPLEKCLGDIEHHIVRTRGRKVRQGPLQEQLRSR